MEHNGKIQTFLVPIATFFLLYAVYHCLTIDQFDQFNSDFIFMFFSLVVGAGMGLVNAVLSTQRKHWRFWPECLVFCGCHGVVLLISWLFFWYYPYFGESGFLYWLAYYFPQAVLVLHLIPGAVVFQMVGYIAWLRLRLKNLKAIAEL